MKAIQRLIKSSKINLVIFILFCVSALLFFACAGTPKNETSSLKNITDQAVSKEISEAEKTGDDQEIECRTDTKTGTRFRKKICATKAEWVIRDRINKERSDRFYRDVNSNTGMPSSTAE